MNKRKQLGKVLQQIEGYRIRQILIPIKIQMSKTTYKTVFTHNGEYGVYAGKKMLKKGSLEECEKFTTK